METNSTNIEKNNVILLLSESEIVRPISDEIKEIRIYGSIEKVTQQNIILTITKPDKISQDLTLSVDDTGNFEVNLNIKKTTLLGKYNVKANYDNG